MGIFDIPKPTNVEKWKFKRARPFKNTFYEGSFIYFHVTTNPSRVVTYKTPHAKITVTWQNLNLSLYNLTRNGHLLQYKLRKCIPTQHNVD